MVRRGDGKHVNYSMNDQDNSSEGDDDDDYGTPPAKKMAKKSPSKKPTPKSATRGPRGKISPAKTPASKKKLQQQRGKTTAIKRNSSGRAKQNISYADDDESEATEPESSDDSSDEDSYRGKGGKKTPVKKSPAKKGPAGRATTASKSQFPPVSEMVIDSIKALQDNPRKGSTVGAIKETIALNWPVNMQQYDPKIKKFLTKAVETGEVIQTKGKGFRGRFTVPGMRMKKKKKASAAKLSARLDEDVEEYKPSKTARDEEREKDMEELERRRVERKMWLEEEAARKASIPKKKVVRKENFEVEDIIGKKKDKNGKVLYRVKFVGWIKPQWEPEENVKGCEEIINEFLKRDKLRLKAEEDRKRREEEDGAYEVKRILEVKFPKNKPREFLIRWVGHGPEDDSWEPEENLTCPDLIEKFMATWEKVSQVDEKRLREYRKPVERLAFASTSRGSRVGKRNHGFRVTYEGMDE